MGYKTEINYILKCSRKEESYRLKQNLVVGEDFIVSKSGERTYILNSPIMFADDNWQILGMCIVMESTVSKTSTVLKAKIISVFSESEVEVISRLIQEAEKSKFIYV